MAEFFIDNITTVIFTKKKKKKPSVFYLIDFDFICSLPYTKQTYLRVPFLNRTAGEKCL